MNDEEKIFLAEIEGYLSIMAENEIHSISVSPGQDNIDVSGIIQEMRKRNFVFNFEKTDLGEIMITRIGFGEILKKIFNKFPKVEEIKFGDTIKNEKKEEFEEIAKKFDLEVFFKRKATIIRRMENE
jgi:nitrogenase subunit NifH